MRFLAVGVLSLVVLMWSAAGSAGAQTSGATVLFLDPSIRASGMGRTSAAVFWGGDPNDRVNPALLGYTSGIRRTWGKTQLVPDLAEDVFFKTDRITIGAMGVGVALVGHPYHRIGRSELDYGESVATGPDGHELSSFSSWERHYARSIGVNVVELAENLVAHRPRAPHPISSVIDLSLGSAWNQDDVFLAPGWATPEGVAGSARVKTRDDGYAIRLTPVDTVYGSDWFPGLKAATAAWGGVRLDLAAGGSVHNRGQVHIAYIDADQADPVFRERRTGYAVHAATGLPPSLRQSLQDRGLAILAAGLSPLVEFGYAKDRTHIEWPASRWPDVRTWGVELGLANILTLRYGRITDRGGDIIGNTYGFGLGFQLADYGGFRWDHAVVPQARVLEHLHRNGITAFVNPLTIAGLE